MMARPIDGSLERSRSKLDEVISNAATCVCAVTLAVLGPQSSRDTSPKYAFGSRVDVSAPATLTTARPRLIRKKLFPGSPSVTILVPGGKSTSSR